LDEALDVAQTPDADLVALDEALTALAQFDPQQSRVVELRYFGGLTIAETAEVLGVSDSTVEREWNLARAWLLRELSR
jgi:RNA polymerase sigma factor (TIGR02999 family)